MFKFLNKNSLVEVKKYKEGVSHFIFGYNDLKITHAYARFYNFGDNALAYGVKNIFLKYFNKNIRFLNEDVHTTIFDKDKLKKINAFSNMLLVGGGGLINASKTNNYWLFNIIEKDFKVLKKPILLYGIGYNNFDNELLNNKVIDNIKFLKNNAIAFSVRNDGSKERLMEYGLDFDEVPDPGFFVNANHPKPNIIRDYVILQICYDAPKERKVDNNKFYSNMITLCYNLLNRNYTVVIAPHCYPDIEISNKIANEINNKNVIVWDWHKIMREDNVTEGLGYYKYAKFVIAMRGHAQICPIGMNTPTISILNHPKHYGLLEKNKLNNLYIWVNDKNFNEKLNNKIDYLLENEKIIKEYYKSLIMKFEKDTALYLEKIKIEIEKKIQV